MLRKRFEGCRKIILHNTDRDNRKNDFYKKKANPSGFTFFWGKEAECLLLAQGADAGQNLALKQLERSATTGGAEGELVGHLELLGCSHGVTTTNDGDAVALSQALGNSLGALGEGIELEHTHGAVPEHGLGALDDGADFLDGLVTDVDAHAALGNLAVLCPGSSAEGLGTLLELEGVASVGGQDELHALAGSIGQNLVGQVELVGLNLGVTHILALSGKEGVSHSTTDDEGLTLLHELGEHLNLVGNLGTTHDNNERLLGGLELALKVLKLVLDEEAHSGLLGEVGHTLGGGVGAVSRAESVVHVQSCVTQQSLGELGVVLLLLLVEANVVQQHHITVLKSGSSSGSGLADGLRNKGNRLAQVAGQALSSGLQRELGLVAGTLGAAQVRAEHQTGALLEQVLNGGQSSHDAGIVGDGTILHGNVEVHAHEDFLTGNVEVTYCEFSHIRLFCWLDKIRKEFPGSTPLRGNYTPN